jgi:hypothetical protein
VRRTTAKPLGLLFLRQIDPGGLSAFGGETIGSVPLTVTRPGRERWSQALVWWRVKMATRKEFSSELHALVKRYTSEGVDPAELANELQDQVNVFIGQHNLEYELYYRQN